MAKILKSYEFQSAVGGGKYPWDEWLDGQIRQLDTDDFGGTAAKYVAHQARNVAFRRGLKVHVSLNEEDDTIVLQAFEMTDEEKANAEVKLAERKEKQKAKKAAAKATANGEAETEEEEAPAPTPKGRKSKKQTA